MSSIFSGCFRLSNFITSLDTKNLINMNSMFYDCKRLTYLDLSYLDTNNVNNIMNMFKYCSNLKRIKVSKDNNKIIERALKWDNIEATIEV